jgi:23S rRNA-/tRNA-specific pseudouridylate synthase
VVGQIIHTLHRHEPPVLGAPINILYETTELIVVDKPPSMPVHPCGKYRHNSLLKILENELGLQLFSTWLAIFVSGQHECMFGDCDSYFDVRKKKK